MRAPSRAAVLAVALVLVATMSGCAGGHASPAAPGAGAAPSATESLRAANAFAVALEQTLLLSETGEPDPEPEGDVSLTRGGVYLAEITSLTVNPATVTFDVYSFTNPNAPADVYPAVNRYLHPQKVRVLPDAAFILQAPAVVGTEYGSGTYRLNAVTFGQLVRYARPDPRYGSEHWWVAIDGDRQGISSIAESYRP